MLEKTWMWWRKNRMMAVVSDGGDIVEVWVAKTAIVMVAIFYVDGCEDNSHCVGRTSSSDLAVLKWYPWWL